MKNAEWMLKSGRKFGNLRGSLSGKNIWRISDISDGANIGSYTVATWGWDLTRPEVCLRWLDQDVEIITYEETKYLTKIITPFIKQGLDVTIAKFHSRPDTECIIISYSDGDRSTSMPFPDFAEGTRYKGMVCGHEYTPKELDL